MWKLSKSLGAALFSLIAFASATPSFAHSMLKSSSITEDAVLAAQPKHVLLTFNHKVGLNSVELFDSVGEKVALSYTPPKDMGISFDVPLPVLKSDSYKLTWRAIAGDGHVMTGDVGFALAIATQ